MQMSLSFSRFILAVRYDNNQNGASASFRAFRAAQFGGRERERNQIEGAGAGAL